jgi:hypothetical protein
MDPLGANPFAILTFIAAPAILTNASSVMSLGTSNRYARAVDRARSLAALLEKRPDDVDAETRLRLRQLDVAERRVLLLVRALTSFYLAMGSFAAASLASLFGATFVALGLGVAREAALVVAMVSGIGGVGGLVSGSALLVWETRMTLRILAEEGAFVRQQLARRSSPSGPAAGI